MPGTCLITGGAGALGVTLANLLLKHGYSVRTLDVRTRKSYPDKIEHITGDVRKPADTDRACDGADMIFHLAAAGPGEHPDHIRDVNINGTANLLESAALTGVETFVLMSCCRVYGYPPPALPCPEDAPLFSGGPFALSKIISEEMCFEALDRNGMKVCAVRAPAVIGPDCGQDPVIDWIFSRAAENLPVFLPRGGGVRRHYVDHEDCARLLLLAAEKDESYGQCFNAGFDRPHTDEQVARAFMRSLRSFSISVPVPSAVTDIAMLRMRAHSGLLHGERGDPATSDSWYDTSKAASLLGWRPEKTLSVSVHEMVRSKKRSTLRARG